MEQRRKKKLAKHSSCLQFLFFLFFFFLFFFFFFFFFFFKNNLAQDTQDSCLSTKQHRKLIQNKYVFVYVSANKNTKLINILHMQYNTLVSSRKDEEEQSINSSADYPPNFRFQQFYPQNCIFQNTVNA
eukprot:TRINITY_DN44082_c0_g1_i1.p2 TRINITY_DN44082_c0_g1~~TRINITY_DN44082_c0_g1_i1.p2  ORF type:complete len:129 (-),score=0.40 TRINITY_DN44082_c0_g1_i1:78-464(-)